MIFEEFFDARCRQIKIIAEAKDYKDVLDIADAYWGDGSAGDTINSIAAALEHAQQFSAGTPVWEFFLNDTAVFFVGSEADVTAKLNAL